MVLKYLLKKCELASIQTPVFSSKPPLLPELGLACGPGMEELDGSFTTDTLFSATHVQGKFVLISFDNISERLIHIQSQFL